MRKRRRYLVVSQKYWIILLSLRPLMMCIPFSSMHKVMQVIWNIFCLASSRKDCTLEIESFSYSPHKGDEIIYVRISNSHFAALAQICFHYSGGFPTPFTSRSGFRGSNGYYPQENSLSGPEATERPVQILLILCPKGQESC